MKYPQWIILGLLALAWQAASAAPPRNGPDRPGIVHVRQPPGTPTRASSFAPHPVSTRVFGAPIQAPILFSARHPGGSQTH